MSAGNGPTAGRARSLLWLWGLLIVFVAINVRWLWLFRHGQPLNIDEAGYLGVSLQDYFALSRGGLRDFIATLEAPSGLAPLTPALAALLYSVTGPHVIAGFLVLVAAGAGTIAATYFLGVQIGSWSIGLMSAALVASCPMIVWYVRTFQFSLPSTVLATLALLALLRSDRCRSFAWASVFGICVGLMPLARTMTIAFVPGLLLGAAIYTLIDPVDRRRRSFVLLWSFLLAFATAMTWLGPNGRYVFQYLLGYGYGNHAAEYGPANVDARFVVRTLVDYVHLPHSLIILAGELALVWFTIRALARDGLRGSLQSLFFSPILPILIYIAEAAAALASSQNKGDGFSAPIIPAAITLAVWACCQMSQRAAYRSVVVGVTACVAILATVPAMDQRWQTARPWQVDMPLLGSITVTDGRGSLQLYEAAAGLTGAALTDPLSPAGGKAWIEFNAATAKMAVQTEGAVAFGFRHLLYNINTVRLQELIAGDVATTLIQIDPIITGDSVAGNVAWLTQGGAAQARILLTSDDAAAEFPPAIDNGRMVDAAMQAGFQLTARWVMPNGRSITVWKRADGAAR